MPGANSQAPEDQALIPLSAYGAFAQGGRSCNEAELSAARVKVEERAGLHADNAILAHECRLLHPCCRPRVIGTTLDDIVFLVMASAGVNKERAVGIRKSWARHLKRDAVWMFADGEDTGIGLMTLPELAGKSDREGAKHRTLRGAAWLVANRPDLVSSKKWFFMVDDDTWVNIPRLVEFVNDLDHRLPLLAGYVWRHGVHLDMNHVSGGAGMLMSQEGFRRIASNLYNRCPYDYMGVGTFLGCSRGARRWSREEARHARGCRRTVPSPIC
jgi:hypothetical protein